MMLSGSVGPRLLRSCRLATRDQQLWKVAAAGVVGKSGNGLLSINHCGLSSEAPTPEQQVEQASSQQTGPNRRAIQDIEGPSIKRPSVNNAAAHLFAKQQLESKVKECSTLAAVLCQIVDLKMKPIHSQIVLQRLSDLASEKSDVIKEELDTLDLFSTPLFLKVGEALENNISRVPVLTLLNCLSSLLSLSPNDINLIKSLETQATWLMRRLTIGQLVGLVEIHASHQETELRKQMYQEALASVEKRWVEINNPRDVVTLLYLTQQNSHKLNDKLEEKALELAEEMSPKELYRVAYLLAKKRHRNTPLLRAITYHLNKSKLSLTPVQFSNLLFSCSSLNICDNALLQKITVGLRQKVSQGALNNMQIHPSILHSLANLRWQDQLTIDVLLESVQQNLSAFSDKGLAGVLCSLAKLNYNYSSALPLLTTIREKLSDGRGLEAGIWVDVVWSLAVLKLLTPPLAASVLNAEFFISMADGDPFKTLARHIKLLNIQAAADYELENYTGPTLPPFADSNTARTMLMGRRGLAESVLTVLNSMAPSDQYMKVSTVSRSGYLIDADLFVNLSGYPLVFSDYCDKQTAAVKRLAIRVLDFADLTLDTRVPTGLHAMAARHLAAEGYTLIEIPYTEFDERGTAVQKVQYIQQKINTAIGKTQPTTSSTEAS